MFLLPVVLIREQWVPAPPWVIDSRDALSSHPLRPHPGWVDSIAFHELIYVAPRSCTSNAGTTLVSSHMTPWGTQSMRDLLLASMQPHLHTALQNPHCVISASKLNPTDRQSQNTRISLCSAFQFPFKCIYYYTNIAY